MRELGIAYGEETLRQIGVTLSDWFDEVGRDLPWRHTRDPYRIWVSEVMLQQTRVETVKAYYERFLTLFPDVYALARADEQEVLKAWEGLGYYRRARYLHRGAQWIVSENDGKFPETPEALRRIPGIGDYCAGSIASLAFGCEVPCVDGNVMRVLSRICLYEGQVDKPAGKRDITDIAQAMIPQGRVWSHNQALMELGALVCLPKSCRRELCPVADACLAVRMGLELTLPVKTPRKEQTLVNRRIYLCRKGDRILVRLRQKEDGLLEGLWEFPGEDETGNLPENWGFSCPEEATLSARHVFTHRIWEMQGYEVEWTDAETPEHCCWVNLSELLELPFPTAMKAFVNWAKKNMK